jgi:fatty acid desaturase
MKLERGYSPPRNVEEVLKPFRKDDFERILTDGLVFLSSIYLAWVAFTLLLQSFLWAAVLVYPVILLFVARQLRAVELIVHDASHYNFMRRSRELNDWLADWIFAAPVSQTVHEYRGTHFLHHKDFGGSQDPCLRRMVELNKEDASAGGRRKWALGPSIRYIISYYGTVAPSSKGLFSFIRWHAVVGAIGISALALFSDIRPVVAACSWTLVWMVPLLTTLPLLRMRAERDEHDYFIHNGTEFSATLTSVGFLNNLIFHPWNDAFHLLHHLYPDIPQTRHKRVHDLLHELDSAYQRRRTNGRA